MPKNVAKGRTLKRSGMDFQSNELSQARSECYVTTGYQALWQLLVATSPGARVTAELGLCPDAEVPPRNLETTIGGQCPIRRCPLLESI